MKIGRFQIEQLSEGHFEIYKDGGIHKKSLGNEGASQAQEHLIGSNRPITTGINPLYIHDGSNHIVVDPGLGWGLDEGTPNDQVSNVVTNLDIFGVKPEQVSHVIFTHLHYDHTAGATYTESRGNTRPTFINADYFVQKMEWKAALEAIQSNQSSLNGATYRLDDLYRLMAEGQLSLIDESHHKLLPGVELERTGGHTKGHQIIAIKDDEQSAYFLGDLIPSENHLNQYSMRKMDVQPLISKKVKTHLLKRALQEKAILFFYHSLHSKVGQLQKDQSKKYVLKQLEN